MANRELASEWIGHGLNLASTAGTVLFYSQLVNKENLIQTATNLNPIFLAVGVAGIAAGAMKYLSYFLANDTLKDRVEFPNRIQASLIKDRLDKRRGLIADVTMLPLLTIGGLVLSAHGFVSNPAIIGVGSALSLMAISFASSEGKAAHRITQQLKAR